ncbi:MAG: aldehyde dehydrogenase family protein [Pseudomonadota bacterium]
MIEARLFIGGKWQDGAGTSSLGDRFTGQAIARVHQADAAQVDLAVRAAKAAFDSGEIPIPDRYAILMRARDILLRRKDEIIDAMVSETGYCVADNAGDFNRCVQTLLTSAEEAKRITGEIVPIDAAPGHDGQIAFTIRRPLGVVACITPFNSPLNTTDHKIAPALAAGNAVVLKPAGYTPLSALLLCEVLQEAGVPAGWLNLVNGPGGRIGQALVDHPDVAYIAFTGSEAAGRSIQASAGLRRTQMELGSISGTIICADGDLDRALTKCAATAFRKSGQVCTSLQRLLVHEDVFETFADMLTSRAEAMVVGDPRAKGTDIGVMITDQEAARVQAWVDEAVAQGARQLTSRRLEGAALMPPTVLTDVSMDMQVMREEIFGPVVCLIPFFDLDAAIALVNNSPYGLAAGIFTQDIDAAFRAARAVEVGLFNINNASSNRADLMPYGGCKASGFGREGPRAAIRDMTEERLITLALN